ncbi:MAG: UDP-glucose 4-epimerase GalE [Planctomycetota bacterium]|nr:UDP-glucose 4-epimerase GalE [Planctomycetota bacterium]
MFETVLLTGGAGFIGSHVCLEIARAGKRPLILDNFSNSKPSVIDRLAGIIGKPVDFVKGDIRDGDLIRKVIKENRVSSVIHLAGLKAVGESVSTPLSYYDNNVVGALRLLEAMCDCGVYSFVFSSSATVYGDPIKLPIDESHPLSATNPYGRTKLAIEEMLRDLHRSDERWRVCLLRYFNPIGAHSSGMIGEDPNGIPNNLMPFVLKVAAGQFKELNVWGNDYPTPDGTGIRDYIHVVDLAVGHVQALDRLDSMGCEAINLGTGCGSSVLEVVNTFERVNGIKIPHIMKGRRAGDIPTCYADASFAARRLGWKAKLNLEDMCRDSWKWQKASVAN